MNHLETLSSLSREQKIDYLMNLDYEITYKRKNTSHAFFIRKLGIHCSSNSLEDLGEELNKAKLKYFEYLIDYDFLNQTKFPEYELLSGFKIPKYYKTMGRYLLIGLFYIMIFSIGSGIIASKLEKTGTKLKKQIVVALNPEKDEMKSRILTFRDKLDLLLPYIKEVESFKKENSL